LRNGGCGRCQEQGRGKETSHGYTFRLNGVKRVSRS
jgi:hypothetical protein